MDNRTLEEKKKIIYEFICDARYVPMKQKELAVILQVSKESRPDFARLLEEVMTSCGFRPYQGEWWHFSDTDPYPVEENFQPETEEEEEPANADYGH